MTGLPTNPGHVRVIMTGLPSQTGHGRVIMTSFYFLTLQIMV